MFRTKKRSEEPSPQPEPKNPPSPKELLAKEAQMAERLLEDLVPEEPAGKKEAEGPRPEEKPDSRPVQPGVAEAAKPEQKPIVEEKKPEEARKEESGQRKEEGMGPVSDDQLPVLMQKIQQLGNDLVGIRSEIRTLREGYTSKTKEMEELQAKLKENLTQLD